MHFHTEILFFTQMMYMYPVNDRIPHLQTIMGVLKRNKVILQFEMTGHDDKLHVGLHVWNCLTHA